MVTPTDTEIRAAIAAERRELAELLTGLPARQWDAGTLCAGWRVREVVAHMTMPYRYSTPRVLVELLKSGGKFNRMADRCARNDTASVSAEELARCLKENANHPWKPPGGGFVGALSHDVIHGLDITVPLGLDRRVPAERLRVVLDGTNARHLKFFGVDLDGVQLRADDLDWTWGTGAPLTGAAQDLLLVLCGRKLPAGHLLGAASDRFTA
ncbi:maleylpyruvate isomerase family mycothiol-dependent enzyme [Amycolatopsis anabasis]|uniref:maleylpyruvate isomerase family mycothiol-dependent enzyme n=1 Tax=Amycolatopsis anabasis TaxID=1840409 RepID=UPI00131E5DC1|nr:maleylpyruvate isomerase family mycothiol-dependent enzyme [Amycolatopsis anabasis]